MDPETKTYPSGCTPTRLFRAVHTTSGIDRYFCQSCDERHENESWLTWLDLELHVGVASYRTQERRIDLLTGRLRWMLYKESGQEALRHVSFEEAACYAGENARGVLDHLTHYEAANGRKRSRYAA